MNFLWFCALVITHAVAYAWGYDNGESKQMDEDRQLELQKYSYDKFYEHERWKAERDSLHDS